MAAPVAVSVIVVSRGRPRSLLLCLKGIAQLSYLRFEVVVVADPASLHAVETAGWEGLIKTIAFDQPNISRARNLGIENASGDVVAFIDDDAVPEPAWLHWLVAPFADTDVSAAGGFVRGRNGISFQWKARSATPDGRSQTLKVAAEAATVLTGTPDRAIRTEGTNMAFRRDTLASMGGFNPAFRFYLEETDLNLRLGAAGLRTAIVPMAQVHHGFAASERRRADRVPRELFDIGASLAVFLRLHMPGSDPAGRRMQERAEQRQRLLRHMVSGAIEPGDVDRLLDDFDAGWCAGTQREILPLLPLPAPRSPFLDYPSLPPTAGHSVISGRSWQIGRKKSEAAAAVAGGARVSLYIFAASARYHRMEFDSDGYWMQSGGLFGRSERTDPLLKLWTFKTRLHREVERVQECRLGRSDNRNKDAEQPF
jgi:O-antigen biosynthesis protein